MDLHALRHSQTVWRGAGRVSSYPVAAGGGWGGGRVKAQACRGRGPQALGGRCSGSPETASPDGRQRGWNSGQQVLGRGVFTCSPGAFQRLLFLPPEGREGLPGLIARPGPRPQLPGQRQGLAPSSGRGEKRAASEAVGGDWGARFQLTLESQALLSSVNAGVRGLIR